MVGRAGERVGRAGERGRREGERVGRAGVRGERREEGGREREEGAYRGMWNSPVTTLFRVFFTPSVCGERDYW